MPSWALRTPNGQEARETDARNHHRSPRFLVTNVRTNVQLDLLDYLDQMVLTGLLAHPAHRERADFRATTDSMAMTENLDCKARPDQLDQLDRVDPKAILDRRGVGECQDPSDCRDHLRQEYRDQREI